MGERGSAILETALIFPITMFFIALCTSSFVIIYNVQRNRTISQRNLYENSSRRPCEVIRNSEYFLELAEKTENLLDIFQNGNVLS